MASVLGQVEIPSLMVDLVLFHLEPGLVSLLPSRSERIFNTKLIVGRRSALIDLPIDYYPISVVEECDIFEIFDFI